MHLKPRRSFVLQLSLCMLWLLACDLTSLVGNSTQPSVVISTPPSGSRVEIGTRVAIQSTATDAQGLARIELWVDGTLTHSETLPTPQTSYTAIQSWTATTSGAHVIQVRAYNIASASSVPAAISIEVVPLSVQAVQPSAQIPGATGTPTPAQVPDESLIPAATSVSTPSPTTMATSLLRNPNPTTEIRKPATPYPPADLPFNIDCSALDSSKQPACDLFISNTRDLVYPLLREFTGISLSSCYDAVYYQIVPDEQLSAWMGQADKNRILYSERATLDAAPAPLYDAHELLHTFAFCSGALDQHIFHGAVESHIDLTLTGYTWQNPGRELVADWLEKKRIPEARRRGVATPEPGQSANDPCTAIYGDLVLILYYDSGIEPVKQLYRATINPGSQSAPNPTLSRLFGTLGNKAQALVNGLKQDIPYPLALPECGY